MRTITVQYFCTRIMICKSLVRYARSTTYNALTITSTWITAITVFIYKIFQLNPLIIVPAVRVTILTSAVHCTPESSNNVTSQSKIHTAVGHHHALNQYRTHTRPLLYVPFAADALSSSGTTRTRESSRTQEKGA